jgi:hypothetical protein
MENRYAPPSNFESSSFGTMCKVVGENGTITTYVQISEDKDHPDWQKLGSIFDAVYQDSIELTNLVNMCISLYVQKKRDNLTDIPLPKKV